MESVSNPTFNLDNVFKILDDRNEKDRLGKICRTIHGQLLNPDEIVNLFGKCKEHFDTNQLLQIFKDVQVSSKYDFKGLLDLINTFRNDLDLPVFDYFCNMFSVILNHLNNATDSVMHFKREISILRTQIQAKEIEVEKLSETINKQAHEIEEQKKVTLRIAQLEKEILSIRGGAEGPILADIRAFIKHPEKNPTTFFKFFEDYAFYPNLVPKAIKENLDTYQDNDVQYSVLHEAIRQGDVKLAKELIANGANLNIRDYMGSTPLHLAIQNGNMEIFEIILSFYKKIDVNAQDIFGNTALHLAAMYGIATAIDALCNCPRINLNVKNAQGMTPIECVSLDDGGLCQAIFIAFGD